MLRDLRSAEFINLELSLYTSHMEHVKKNTKWYLFGILLLSTSLIWYAVLDEEKKDILTVAFLDVSQGDSILTLVTQHTT